jgi:hypothetical protein
MSQALSKFVVVSLALFLGRASAQPIPCRDIVRQLTSGGHSLVEPGLTRAQIEERVRALGFEIRSLDPNPARGVQFLQLQATPALWVEAERGFTQGWNNFRIAVSGAQPSQPAVALARLQAGTFGSPLAITRLTANGTEGLQAEVEFFLAYQAPAGTATAAPRMFRVSMRERVIYNPTGGAEGRALLAHDLSVQASEVTQASNGSPAFARKILYADSPHLDGNSVRWFHGHTATGELGDLSAQGPAVATLRNFPGYTQTAMPSVLNWVEAQLSRYLRVYGPDGRLVAR